MGRQIRLRRVRVAASALAVAVAAGCAGSPAGSGGGGGSGVPVPGGGGALPSPPASSAAPPAGGAEPARGDVLPGLVDAETARAQLAALTVAAPGTMAGYSRSRFTHWAEQGDRCDTRETVLQRDGQDVVRDAECRAVTGTWRSLYDGAVVTEASGMDIDHIVPLAEGWRSGAAAWDAAKRKAFANDLLRPQLLAVSAASNRSKGDQAPDRWQPPDRSSWCQYGRAWTTVKAAYGLTATEDEKRMLGTMLDTCS
ncbi:MULTISPECIES: HNH endonuclease family protein [Streptomyces]|uniref:HNH endonuclease family protein n=1 Tax=Streptomyces TaxID=1883 RepID=UPI0019CB99EE|nr:MULTISPECIES: HNH endonuclease family protein [Streptomyces]GGT31306.1 hypothetical protein GCM10010286_65400 [Streptomyces toxytricini]